MRATVLALALSLAEACADTTGPSRGPRLGEPFDLRVGESVTLGDELLAIGFISVANDSRCPSDVVCIVAGEATLRLRVGRLSQRAETLEVKTPGPEPGRFGSYRITVRSLMPAPVSTRPTEPSSYVTTLIVTREP